MPSSAWKKTAIVGSGFYLLSAALGFGLPLVWRLLFLALFFFFNDTAPTEIYPLSLHAALPISRSVSTSRSLDGSSSSSTFAPERSIFARSEEHTAELQSRPHLVCRLLLERKEWSEAELIWVFECCGGVT